MLENLDEYFISVCSRADISALPVPETKFESGEADYLGQLIVTQQMVAQQIRDMKDNNWDSSHITLGNCRTNDHSSCNSVQFVIRGGRSFFRMERSKHHNII